MSQRKEQVSDKDESWLKIEKEMNRDAYGARVGTRDDVTNSVRPKRWEKTTLNSIKKKHKFSLFLVIFTTFLLDFWQN